MDIPIIIFNFQIGIYNLAIKLIYFSIKKKTIVLMIQLDQTIKMNTNNNLVSKRKVQYTSLNFE